MSKTINLFMKHSMVASLLLLFFLLVPFAACPPFGGTVSAAQMVGVYIRADGSVQGTNNILRIGDLYTLVGDVTGPLIVEKDNIVIDGAGYSVACERARGIVLANRYGVTVKDTTVTLGGGYNIDLTNASNCVIEGNTLTGAPGPMMSVIAINFLYSEHITVKNNVITNFFEGLALEWSSGHIIMDNTITNGVVGMTFTNATDCILRNNHVRNCSHGFSLQMFPGYLFNNDLDTSNTVDGKPIYYWINQKDRTVPPDALYIVLVNCKNIHIAGGTPQSIRLASTTDSTITNVKMIGRGDGIMLLDCSNIDIFNNTLRDRAIGITIESSYNNRIVGNEISNQQTRGIALNNATDNLIQGNTLTNNSYAIGTSGDSPSKGNTISYNNFIANGYTLTMPGNSNVTGNHFEANDHAIMFSSGTGSTVTYNTFINNKNALYFSSSSGNSIYLNNFLQNDHQVVDGGVSSTLTQTQKLTPDSGKIQLAAARFEVVNFMPPPPPSINQYDNGVKGNYWVEYQGHDSNGDGIGDAPFVLYPNNQDNHPLMSAVYIAPPPALSPLANTPSPSTNTTQATDNVSKGDLDPIMVAVLFIVVLLLIAASLLFYYKKHTP